MLEGRWMVQKAVRNLFLLKETNFRWIALQNCFSRKCILDFCVWCLVLLADKKVAKFTRCLSKEWGIGRLLRRMPPLDFSGFVYILTRKPGAGLDALLCRKREFSCAKQTLSRIQSFLLVFLPLFRVYLRNLFSSWLESSHKLPLCALYNWFTYPAPNLISA